MSTLKELRDVRVGKLQKLVELGINPFPSNGQKDYSHKHIIDNYEKLEGQVVHLSGRLMSLRAHGGLIFGDLHDQTGKIQLYIHKDELNPTSKKEQTIGFDDFNLIDIGDFLEAEGEITKTKKGEISIRPTKIKLITKSIRPLPEKWEGLQDKEVRYRRRYLDFTMNPERRELFERKSKFWEVNREFMKSKGFIEVQTPILEHIPGGADARPFTTHMNALSQDFYLRISPELYLKRLIGGGFEKVYSFGPNFRNEGLSDEHLAEFYNIEWYWAYADYKDNMAMVKEMFKHIALEVYGTTKFIKGEHTFDLADKWEEIDYMEIIKERFGVDIFTTSDDEIMKILKEQKVDISGVITRNRLIDNLWKIIRKTISGPAFLVNEPKFMSPLAKSKPGDDRLTERFHNVIAGSELGNGYSELNDPFDQFDRFKEQQDAKDAGDDESQMMDIDFIEMLEYGMPPTSGYAHGERLFWFLEGLTAREGTLFPQLKYHVDEATKEIYDVDFDALNKGLDYRNVDENKKDFTVVLNGEVDTGKLMNALGHLSIGLAKGELSEKDVLLVDYHDKDENIHAKLSHYPFVVLKADDSREIYKLRQSVLDSKIKFMDFTESMTIGNTKAKVSRTKKLAPENMKYLGIILYGNREEIKKFTKKYELFKGNNCAEKCCKDSDGGEGPCCGGDKKYCEDGAPCCGDKFESDSPEEGKVASGGDLTIEKAYSLLEKYIKNESLRKHSYCVESAMRHYAQKLDPENEELWAIVGLLHDLDYEMYPDKHPLMVKEILPDEGFDDETLIKAILSHYEELTKVKPETLMERCLLACDELTGIITAASLMRPTGISDLKYSSIKKKLKSKGFARGVDREIVQNGYEMFAEVLDEKLEFSKHTENVIEAMRNDNRLGLSK